MARTTEQLGLAKKRQASNTKKKSVFSQKKFDAARKPESVVYTSGFKGGKAIDFANPKTPRGIIK